MRLDLARSIRGGTGNPAGRKAGCRRDCLPHGAQAVERKRLPTPPPEFGSEVKILQFYASPSVVAKGQQAILCYGVANAKTVRLEPTTESFEIKVRR
ncbi:MAG: hypothetical protein ACLQGV_17710 [Bryobacteraceae bacterium]